MAKYTQSGAIPCTPDSTLTTANANQRLAVRLDVGNAANTNENPTVSLTSTTATTDEVLGEYQTNENGNTVKVCNTGTMILRASAAYAAANNGFGVVASATAGIVQVAGAIGGGLGRITGGGTETIGGASVNVLRVLVS